MAGNNLDRALRECVTYFGGLTVPLTTSGTITCSGVATFSGATTVSGALTASGTNTLSGATTVSGTLTASGVNTLSGATTATALLTTSAGFNNNGGINSETLTEAKTMAVTDAPYQKLDPGGAHRDVQLPAFAAANGLVFTISNAADAAENLVVKDAAGTVATINQNECATFGSDGTDWYHMGVVTIAQS